MKTIADKIFAENIEAKSPILNLCNSDLNTFPENLAQMEWLRGIDITNTTVSDLTPLTSIKGLQSLNITNTRVSDLAPLANLADLKGLNASGTPVRDLAPLAKSAGLKTLELTGTMVTDLSPLSELTGLLSLNITNTEVSDLRPLEQLSGLEKLTASRSKTTDLSSLAHLTGLRILNIEGTEAFDLTPLATLVRLKKLNASQGPVCDLSPLSELYGLEALNILETKVSDLSPLARLIHLRKLNFSGCKVTDLFPVLPLIQAGIPVSWKPISNGFGSIVVKNCPLTNPPAEIVKQGNDAILNYFSEKQTQGEDHLYEAKLLIVGEGGAGKTSLLRRLYQTDLPLPDERETTKGIAVHRHEFKLQDQYNSKETKFRLNVWDFGGQEIYHATHQFFLTERSLYVLLDDTRKDYKTVHDEGFKYWLEAVDLLSSHSPVLIFQNEKDDRSKAIDLAGIKGKFDNVKECYQGNLEHPGSVDKLRDAIEFHAKNLPHIGEALPAQWIAIRATIERQAQTRPTITQQEYFSIYGSHLPFDRTKALHLSRYLHDLGVFLHFQDDSLLRRTVIMQNNWATEAVFRMLDDEAIKAELGRFTINDCERLWQDSQYAEMHLELLTLMQKFELCYPLPDIRPNTWLAPQLLPPSKPNQLGQWEQAGDLVLRFNYEFLPKGMISRLMVRQHRFVPRPELSWATGVLFERDDTQVLVKVPPKGGEIVLRARGSERKELLSIIAADLDALNETFSGLGEKVSKWIPCNCRKCTERTSPEFFEQRRLFQRKKDGKLKVECPASYEDVDVLELLDGISAANIPPWGREQHVNNGIPGTEIIQIHEDNIERFIETAREKAHTSKFLEWFGESRATLALVFTDIVGSTALGEALKDEAMGKVRQAHFKQSRRLISKYHGKEIKTLGDSFMTAFLAVENALDYAMELQAIPGHECLLIRAGIHIGPMDLQEQDVFGSTVNFSARVVSAIKGAEIWLSDEAKKHLDSSATEKHNNLKWNQQNDVMMKGFEGTYTLWSLKN